MKKFMLSGLLATLAAGTASADLIEITFDMAGTSVDDPSFVYGTTGEWNAYAGEMIVGIGVRDLVVDFTDAVNTLQFAWAMDLSNAGYGQGIFIFATDGPYDAGAQEIFNFEFDISTYGGQVLPADHYGEWNIGAFIGSDTGGGAVTIASGEMYFIIDSNIPAPGALALLGVAGIATRRRRK